ncbi:hypothetical protein HG541_10040 [Proteus terrae subsp. cibarius]|uniref:hypothetical protein n=1 Tax=Proteus TaxID=583 RepID=UPI0011EC6074|nr:MULTISPECIES: hypothetical protein [Proteus]QEK49114.1 hypothetical protein FY167_14320 [Proteus mirabilis]QKD67857.1 hypothetical protein HG541_10040 [Proteus terrae subsp. cibarius]
MSNQNLEVLVDKLLFQVAQQGLQIVELQKQLADMQKATSCGKEKLLKLYECKTKVDNIFLDLKSTSVD